MVQMDRHGEWWQPAAAAGTGHEAVPPCLRRQDAIAAPPDCAAPRSIDTARTPSGYRQLKAPMRIPNHGSAQQLWSFEVSILSVHSPPVAQPAHLGQCLWTAHVSRKKRYTQARIACLDPLPHRDPQQSLGRAPEPALTPQPCVAISLDVMPPLPGYACRVRGPGRQRQGRPTPAGQWRGCWTRPAPVTRRDW